MNKARKPTIGRPAELEIEELEKISFYIHECYKNNNPRSVIQLIDYIFCTFNKSINEKTLRSILKRSSQVKMAQGIPLEKARVDVIIEHFEALDKMLCTESVPPEFFFNVDESGFQAFADAVNQRVIVPIDADDSVYYSVDRQSKRATLIGCICLDGSALKPFVISPNKTVSRELALNGYNESNCLIVHQENGFITAEIFAFWARMIFFPEVAAKRQKYHYEGTVVLTLDGCTCHNSDLFLDDCTYAGIYPWFEPAGSSDQVQALDLGIFSCQKSIKTRLRSTSRLSANEKNIVDIVDTWMKSTTPGRVVSSFNQAGIFIESTEHSARTRASAAKGRAVRGIEHESSNNEIKGRKNQKIIGQFEM